MKGWVRLYVRYSETLMLQGRTKYILHLEQFSQYSLQLTMGKRLLTDQKALHNEAFSRV